jgi:hypothetical protein
LAIFRWIQETFVLVFFQSPFFIAICAWAFVAFLLITGLRKVNFISFQPEAALRIGQGTISTGALKSGID